MAGNCDCGNELLGSIYCGEILDNIKHISFCRRTVLHGVKYRVNYVRHYTDFRKACSMFVMAVSPSLRTHRITRPHMTDLKEKD